MRLWSLHPQLLDQKGLVAVWRESLLAQAVLSNKTRGYRHHPQLLRFQQQADPLANIGAYLLGIHKEARKRGYNFDQTKIYVPNEITNVIFVTSNQLQYERAHLNQKLELRDPNWLKRSKRQLITTHPLFKEVSGPIETWEKVNSLVH